LVTEDVSLALVQASLIGEAIDPGPVLAFVADEDMRYVAVNQYACDVLGYTRSELLALRITDLAPEPGTTQRFKDFIATQSVEGDSTLRRKDGSDVHVHFLAKETTAAGLTLYVWVGFLIPDEA
jgi:PAS domain S-box-containing protein